MPRVVLRNTFLDFEDFSPSGGEKATWQTSPTEGPTKIQRSLSAEPVRCCTESPKGDPDGQLERLNQLANLPEVWSPRMEPPLERLKRRWSTCPLPDLSLMDNTNCEGALIQGVTNDDDDACSDLAVRDTTRHHSLKLNPVWSSNSISTMCTASGCVSPSPGEGEEGEEGSCSPGTRQVAGELSSGRSRSKHQRVVQRKCLETSSNADANPTTIMLRNIPNRYSQRELMLELEELGFEDCFDFVYLPFDKATGLNLGYAFVNFVHSSHYEKCFTTFEEHRFTRYQEGNYKKVAKVSRAHLQGLEANVAHYENTAVKTSKHRRRRPLVLAKKYSTIS